MLGATTRLTSWSVVVVGVGVVITRNFRQIERLLARAQLVCGRAESGAQEPNHLAYWEHLVSPFLALVEGVVEYYEEA